MPRALITCRQLQRSFERYAGEYAELGVEAVLPEVSGQQLEAPEMRAAIAGADAVIAGDDVIDASVLETAAESGIRGVVKWGVGTDAIDLDAATRLGVPVFNTPGMFADEVADLAMSHLLLLARRAHAMHASVVEGGWQQVVGRSLTGLGCGVIGLGSIGCAVAHRASAFGMRVLGCDVRPVSLDEHGVPGLRQVGFEELLAASDAVVLACQLTDANRGLLSKPALERMGDGALVINVSRGGLIDQEALADALESGRVAGAGLDVFAEEPLPPDDRLRGFSDRCVFTTHNGSSTAEAIERTNRLTSDILFDLLGLRAFSEYVPNRVA